MREMDGKMNLPSCRYLSQCVFCRKVNFRLTTEFKFAQLGINELE